MPRLNPKTGLKICCDCGINKSGKEYYNNKSRPDKHSDQCKRCDSKRNDKWRKNNQEYNRKEKAEYHMTNRERDNKRSAEYGVGYREANSKREAKRSADWYQNNKDRCYVKTFRRHLKVKYGMTFEEYGVLVAASGGVCGICGRTESAVTPAGKVKRLSVDHNHKTKKIRGLLCDKCNTGLGKFKDSSDLLRKAALYLDRDCD